MYSRSSVPVPEHVAEAQVEGDVAPDLVEAAVRLVVVPDHVPVRAVAEGRVGRELAVAQLVVAALGDVEVHRAAARHVVVAVAVAVRVGEREPARAPGVHLALLQVGVVREEA